MMKLGRLILFAAALLTSVSALALTKPYIAADDHDRVIDSLNNRAFSLYLRWPDSARMVAEQAVLLSEKKGYNNGLGRAYLYMGHIYWSQAYYPVALYYLNQSLSYLQHNQADLLADCYGLIGRTYSDLHNYKAALNYIHKSELIASSPRSAAVMHSRYSNVYFLMGDYGRSLQSARKALVLDKKLNDLDELGITYSRFASIYQAMHNFHEAILYNDSAVGVSSLIHNNRLRAKSYVEYAQIYNQQHEYDKAIVFAKRGMALGDSTGIISAILPAYASLVDSYYGKRNMPLAMAYQKKISAVQDSLNNFNQVKNLQLINDYFNLNKQIREIEQFRQLNANSEARIRQQRTIIFVLIGSLLLVTTVLWAVWHFYKQKRQLTAELEQRHSELSSQKILIESQAANLQAANNVKDKLLAVIGHDLRSPFANLRGIIEIFEAGYISNEEMQKLLIEMASIIKGAELTLLNLMEWAGGNIKAMSVKAEAIDIAQLANEMEQTFGHQMQRKNILFQCEVCDDCRAVGDANHIRIVMRNLISNAVKFTYSEGLIKLKAAVVGDEVIVEVEDTGKGMSEPELNKLFHLDSHFSQSGTSGERGTGIGLILCKELIELNQGRLWITSVPGKGSVFYFSLPKF